MLNHTSGNIRVKIVLNENFRNSPTSRACGRHIHVRKVIVPKGMACPYHFGAYATWSVATPAPIFSGWQSLLYSLGQDLISP